jgi:hypothetical protein
MMEELSNLLDSPQNLNEKVMSVIASILKARA